MTDPQQTLPPKVAEAESLLKNALAWSQAHTVVTAAAVGFALGWLLPKILKWVL